MPANSLATKISLMVAETFDKILRAFCKRKPFRAFTVQLVSGDRIRIEHPEALLFRSGTGIYLDPDGDWTFFDNEGVAQVTDLPEQKKLRDRKAT